MMGHRGLLLAPALALLFSLSASCTRKDEPPVAAADVCPPAQASAPADIAATLRAKAEADGAVRVIVEIAAPQGARPAMSNLHGAALQAFRDAGVTEVAPLTPRLAYLVAEVNPAQLDALYPDPRFGTWSEDRLARASLAQSGPLVQAPQLWAAGARGAGQGVAILDTGVDGAHPFLAGRVIAEACFSTNSPANRSSSVCPNGQAEQNGAGAARPCAATGCEHGTHVAGIAAGRGADFSGMAPDADIIAVQVFSRFTGAACGGQAACVASFTSDQIRALDFVRQLAATRAVAAVNMSLGGGRSTTACDSDITKPVIDQLRAVGVATVIASGNDGFRDSVSFPGCISSAVTVGATTKTDTLADFSNCGPQVDLHAPGVGINSSIPGGRFAAFSGTSMATPHVAGAFAALRSRGPAVSIDQIETALKQSGGAVAGRPHSPA
jgi:subtilisin family serine protease